MSTELQPMDGQYVRAYKVVVSSIQYVYGFTLRPLGMVEPIDKKYQSMVQPPGAVALKVMVPGPQRVLLLASVGAAGLLFTVPLTASRDADTQPVEVFRAWA